MKHGFIVLARTILDHPLLQDGERFRAWCWLIARACWKPTKFDISGKTVTLDRGQLCASRSQLAEAWKWSGSAVERFLTRLETEQMIGRETGQGRTILTIRNYSKYQDATSESGQGTGQASEQRSDKQRTTKEPLNQSPKGGVPPINLQNLIWSEGLSALISMGLVDRQARSLIGKWRKAVGDAAVLDLISRAQQQAVSEPVAWIEAAIGGHGGGRPAGTSETSFLDHRIAQRRQDETWRRARETPEERQRRERAEFMEREYGENSWRARREREARSESTGD